MDVRRRLLPRRHHPRRGAAGGAAGRRPGLRKGFFVVRRLWRRRGVLHRHFCGSDARAQSRRPRHRRAQAWRRRRLRPDDAAASRTLQSVGARGSAGALVKAPLRVAMWSGPRNISTAMMRAFGNRADCAVSDEPFYAAYLTATGLIHPMRDDVIAAQPTQWQAVAEAML